MSRAGRIFRSVGLTVAVCGLGIGVGSSAAMAALSDPPGANGTIKIDGKPLDPGVDNEPHVTCNFAVNLFGFDKNQHANLVFTVHPPSPANGPGHEVLRIDDVLISDDPAGGAEPDPDEVFKFSADQFDLSGSTAHAKQGYHIKLTLENVGDTPPGAGKHKVFWLQPCAAPTTPPPSPSGSQPTTPGGGGSTSPGEAGGLPVTGGNIGGMVAAGLGMVVAGAGAVLVMRRRRRLGEAVDL